MSNQYGGSYNLIDKTFGRLFVLNREPNDKAGRSQWRCSCSCGKQVVALGYDLARGHSKSCGCSRKEGRVPDLVGKIFGHLLVLSREPSELGHSRWLCSCVCGEKVIRHASSLKRGLKQGKSANSCGCKACVTHGHTSKGRKSPEYFCWNSMKQRCLNLKSPAFKDYGGRGIIICDRWVKSFESFLADMGPRPPDHSLDRTDPNGNYEPSNCKWATQHEQHLHRRKYAAIGNYSDAELLEEVRRRNLSL